MTTHPTVTIDATPARVQVRSSAATDTGLTRAGNEDSFLCAPPLFVVADGMGGHAHGARASATAVAVLTQRLGGGGVRKVPEVVGAVRAAHDAVTEIRASGAPAGTTLAGVCLVGSPDSDECHWMVFNVGDSRVYTWDGARLDQVSVDHSAVQELIDDGEITPDAAEGHPDQHVITRALGIGLAPDPDVWLLPVADALTFLICSDGLTKDLSDDQIADVLAHSALDDRASRLVAAALSQGGRDNVTVVTVAITLLDARGAADGVTPQHLEDTLERS